MAAVTSLALPPGRVPLSVWATAALDARGQRRGRYVPASVAHPAKMLPAIAATAIGLYTEPGDLVADPMCGIGTTLAEAVRLGRDAAGVEYEARWAQLAAANVRLARSQGAAGRAKVITGDARALPALLPGLAGTVALVVTSPPYGRSVHGQVHATLRPGGGGVRKYDNRYSDDPANLASRSLGELLDGFTRILAGCRELLAPGGTVVVTARPWRERGELIDLPAAVLTAGTAAGLVPAERCVALLAGLRGQGLVARPSFFQLDNVRKARARGEPQHLIVHEDVLVFRNSAAPLGFPRTQGSSEQNPRDVVLSAGPREVQPGQGSPVREAPDVPETRAA